MIRHVFLIALLCFVTAAGAQDDVAHVPAEDLKLGGNEKQRYFLIGQVPKNPPKEGLGLLIVLPGGDGSAEFHPFVKRIYANALPENYLVAQLVAVPSKNPNQVVWPTAKWPDAKQTFTTEDFIWAVAAEVKAKHPIDEQRVFTLSWSSGGPAAYAASLATDTPVKGSLVAMSVFLPAKLPPLTAAKGQRYFLLQSPDDQVTKYFFAKTAKAQLTKHGAQVELLDYPGGHGWHGDVFGNIRAGIGWLEAERAPEPTTGPAPASGLKAH
jgi:predicted esterase